jgi:cysteine synthase A
LLTRIQAVKQICAQDPNAFWTNQYHNPCNYLGYYDTLGAEICNSFESLDYVFVAVSSGGTITGLSRKLKEKFKDVTIVAVDVEGSVIFGNCPQRRYISGLGSSMVPGILKDALIDRVVLVPQLDIIKGCYELLDEQTIFAGASSGAAYRAVKDFFTGSAPGCLPTALFICADKGSAYMNTIYNAEWVDGILRKMSTAEVEGAH